MSLKKSSFYTALCLLAVLRPATAETAFDAWQFEVTPYLLAAGLDGTVGIRGVEADMDVPFSDVWDNLDGALMGLFTARRNRWSLGFETVYFKLSDEGAKSVTGPFGIVNVDGALELTTKLTIYQGSVGYRVLDDTTTVDLLAALRYTKVAVEADVAITTTPAILFPGGERRTKGSKNWTDAVIGAQVTHPLSETVNLMGYGDIGGGGSDLTFQLIGGVNWTFSDTFTAKAGYRYMSWDYDDDGTVWDVDASGPYLGLGIRF